METISLNAIRFAAMNLLALREHSALELQQKLLQKFAHTDLVSQAITRLTHEGLQSDVRFAEAFIAMRKRQGKGPQLIAMELKERGVLSEHINALLQYHEDTWLQLARSVRVKKFGAGIPVDAKEKAKQIRFLYARGFNSDAIQHALKTSTVLI